MNEQNGIAVTRTLHLPATVNYFLRPPFHFRIAALHRVEIQCFRIGTGIHAGSRTASEADQHAGTSQLNQQCTRREFLLADMPG